jgi:hypothetical protein
MIATSPNRELRWRRQLRIPGCFDGEHIFTIEPLDTGRVRFTQREIVTGFLVPFRARHYDDEMRRGLKEMNQALKRRAEQLTPAVEQP